MDYQEWMISHLKNVATIATMVTSDLHCVRARLFARCCSQASNGKRHRLTTMQTGP